MDHRDIQFHLNSSNFNHHSSNRINNSSSCNYYDSRQDNDPYTDFDGVQDLSYSAQGQCIQEQQPSISSQQHGDDQDVSCMDLSLFLSSPKSCDRQQIEDELPLNLTGKDREDEINRRLRQRQQSFCGNSYSYSYPFNDPPRSSQVFVAPDFLGMHELQDLRTHSYLDDATSSLNLTYCPQTLDLSAQSLDLSLTGQELGGYDDATAGGGGHHQNQNQNPGLNLDNMLDQGTGEVPPSGMLDLPLVHQQHQSLPPASSLPLPLCITQSLTLTSCRSNSHEQQQQYAALDLQQKNQVEPTAAVTDKTNEVAKLYTCAQCGERFGTTSELASHRETHSLAKPFSCDRCGQRFAKVGTLNRHVRATHGHSRPFQCETCDKKFAQKHDLVRHRHTHSRK